MVFMHILFFIELKSEPTSFIFLTMLYNCLQREGMYRKKIFPHVGKRSEIQINSPQYLYFFVGFYSPNSGQNIILLEKMSINILVISSEDL